ncbi:I11RA protein, partial [Nyctibius bracteatus]|nr:I11RA protein [Nyctibius bracteatus]
IRSPIPGLGRVMLFFAAALMSTSLAILKGWGEEGVQYGQVGTDVTLSCTGARTGSLVQWRQVGAAALPEGLAIQQGGLMLPCTRLATAGTYSCHSEWPPAQCACGWGLGSGLPSSPGSWHRGLPAWHLLGSTRKLCMASGGDMSPPHLPICRNKNGHVGPYLQDLARPSTCTIHGSEFWSSYRLNITEVKPLGSSFCLLDITMQAIIKLDPLEGLMVEPIPLAPLWLHVSWKYPSFWPKEPHFQLRFWLQYRPVIHRFWSVVETVNLSEVITDAFAGIEHVVQVSAKDFLDAGNWSEWSAEARATPVRDLATAAREETTTDARLESLAEEPSQAPNPEPINRSDPLEKMAILVSLGIFAFFVLAAVLVITILIW